MYRSSLGTRGETRRAAAEAETALLGRVRPWTRTPDQPCPLAPHVRVPLWVRAPVPPTSPVKAAVVAEASNAAERQIQSNPHGETPLVAAAADVQVNAVGAAGAGNKAGLPHDTLPSDSATDQARPSPGVADKEEALGNPNDIEGTEAAFQKTDDLATSTGVADGADGSGVLKDIEKGDEGAGVNNGNVTSEAGEPMSVEKAAVDGNGEDPMSIQANVDGQTGGSDGKVAELQDAPPAESSAHAADVPMAENDVDPDGAKRKASDEVGALPEEIAGSEGNDVEMQVSGASAPSSQIPCADLPVGLDVMNDALETEGQEHPTSGKDVAQSALAPIDALAPELRSAVEQEQIEPQKEPDLGSATALATNPSASVGNASGGTGPDPLSAEDLDKSMKTDLKNSDDALPSCAVEPVASEREASGSVVESVPEAQSGAVAAVDSASGLPGSANVESTQPKSSGDLPGASDVPQEDGQGDVELKDAESGEKDFAGDALPEKDSGSGYADARNTTTGLSPDEGLDLQPSAKEPSGVEGSSVGPEPTPIGLSSGQERSSADGVHPNPSSSEGSPSKRQKVVEGNEASTGQILDSAPAQALQEEEVIIEESSLGQLSNPEKGIAARPLEARTDSPARPKLDAAKDPSGSSPVPETTPTVKLTSEKNSAVVERTESEDQRKLSE